MGEAPGRWERKTCEVKHKMRERGFPVMIDVSGTRIEAGFRAPPREKPVMIALRLRDRGWDPYKVSFDAKAGIWVAAVFAKTAADEAVENAG
jgi:hypothetical protein